MFYTITQSSEWVCAPITYKTNMLIKYFKYYVLASFLSLSYFTFKCKSSYDYLPNKLLVLKYLSQGLSVGFEPKTMV